MRSNTSCCERHCPSLSELRSFRSAPGAKRLVPGAGDDNAPVRLFGQEPLEKFTQLERRSGVEGVGHLGASRVANKNIAGPFFDPQRLAIPFMRTAAGRRPSTGTA